MTIDVTRRLILATLPALGLAGHALAQTPLTGTRIVPTPEEDAGDLLDAWVDIYGRPTAKVMINGVGPFQFMVDTGSTTTVIAARHMATLGQKQLGQVTVVGTTGTASMPLVRLDKVQTGSVTKLDLDVAVLPDSEMGAEDGILGGDVFVGRRLVFDIRGKSVRIEPTRRRPHSTVLGNMRVHDGLLAEIDGKVGSVSTRMMLDTGAQNCIANMALSEALLRQHPKLQRINNARIFGVTGHKIVGQYIALPRVDLRAFTVREAGCVAADAQIFDQWDMNREPAMIVGVNLLSQLESFSIDYGAQMFDAKLMVELLARNSAAFG